MVVAVAIVAAMQVSLDDVVDVIAVRHRRMPAAGAVHVRGVVAVARVTARA